MIDSPQTGQAMTLRFPYLAVAIAIVCCLCELTSPTQAASPADTRQQRRPQEERRIAQRTPAPRRSAETEPAAGASKRLQAWQNHQELASQSPFKDLPWQAMGPKFAGGRIEAIDCPPGNLGVIYAGVGSGGVWKTLNGGLTWKPIFEDQATFAIGDVTLAPGDPDTIWVGTGECHVGRSSYSGTGVYRSSDAGETWQHMGLEESYHIGTVAIDPHDPQVVFVAAMGWRTGGGQRGVFRTIDGGQTFEHVLKTDRQVSAVDLVIDPADSNRLFASVWDRGGGDQSGVYRSEDQGKTWSRLITGLPTKQIDRVAIAVSQSKPGVVYALMADRSSPNLARRRPAAMLYRSDDYGNTWRRTHQGYVPTYVGWDFCDVRVAPDDADHVYIGGFRLITSRDGGATFLGEGGLAINKTRANVHRLHQHHGKGLHLDVHDIWIAPKHPERVLLGNDGGLFLSHDRAETWLHLNNLPIAEFYRIHLDSETPFQIWGGTQDNASFVGPARARYQAGEADLWKQVFLDPWTGGDGFSTFPDPVDPSLVYFTQQNGDLKRARRDGLNDNQLNLGKRIRPRQSQQHDNFRFAWDTPFFASTHSHQKRIENDGDSTEGSSVLYCASQYVMRSRDQGENWTVISPSLSRQGLVALAESPVDRERLMAGDTKGNLHWTIDGGKHWTACKDLPEKVVRDIVPSCQNPDRVYVVLSGRLENDRRAYVYQSDDFGKTWRSISKQLPDEPANAIAEDPQHPDILFVGTDLGCYVSLEETKDLPDIRSWSSLCQTLPTAPVVDLQVHGEAGKLVAATHGLSIFILDIEQIRRHRNQAVHRKPDQTPGPEAASTDRK